MGSEGSLSEFLMHHPLVHFDCLLMVKPISLAPQSGSHHCSGQPSASFPTRKQHGAPGLVDSMTISILYLLRSGEKNTKKKQTSLTVRRHRYADTMPAKVNVGEKHYLFNWLD